MNNNTKQYLRLTVLSSLLCTSYSGLAANDDYLDLSLEQLGQLEISIATGSSTPIYKAPAVASVITADDIEAMGARTLDDVLETIPGLHVSPSSVNRLDAIYSIRGIHTSFNPHVLLLINEVPIQWGIQGGRPILLRLPTTSIKRIEIIRGPGSAVYGADAYSGVINIVTKDLDSSTGTEVGARIGSFNSIDTWVHHAENLGNWELSTSLSYQTSDGDDDRIIDRDFQSLLDDGFGTSSSLAPGATSSDYEFINTHLNIKNDSWAFNFWSWNSSNIGNGVGGLQTLDPTSSDNNDLYVLDATHKTNSLLKNWNHTTRLSYAYYDARSEFNLLPAGTVAPIGTDGNLSDPRVPGVNPVLFTDGLMGNPQGIARDIQLDFVNTYSGWENNNWRIAFGSRLQKTNSKETKNFGPGVIDGSVPIIDGTLTDVSNTEFVFLPDSSRRINYLSIQDEWQFAQYWQLIAGVRHDEYSDFGSTTNPRIALVWETNEKLTTKFLYGSAFRVPSFFELFSRNNPSVIGNEDLDPETIDTFEVSFNYRPQPNLQTSLNLFRYNAEDLIEFTPVAENLRDQDGYGFEWEIDWRPSNKLRLQANFALQRSQDADTNATIADAPGNQLTLISYWQFQPEWFLNTTINRVADRQRAANDTRADIKDYTQVDFSLQRKNILPQTDMNLSIRNAFDKDIREPSTADTTGQASIPGDIPLEGRSIQLEMSYHFD